jgi:PAS domain S-box-containing protein
MKKTSESDSSSLLRVLVEGTSGETGLEFFQTLTHGMCSALNVEGAWVTEFLPKLNHLRALAFRLQDDWVKEYEYHIDGTPCGEALRLRKMVFVPNQVLDSFPEEHDLRKLKAVSYIGAPIFDEKREIILGHLGAFSVNPMPDTEPFRQIFQLFENRAGAELRRLRLEIELRARTEEVEAIVQSAMDGILIMDEERDIVRANDAAARIFGTTDLVGQMLDKYLSVDGAEMMEPLFERVVEDPVEGSSMWIPGTFEGRSASGEKFAAEGTLSKFSLKDRTFLTLIVRNVSDRLAVERQITQLSEQTAYLREEVEWHFGEIVGESPAMQHVIRDIREVAGTDASVLVTGETGTGKELVARALHRASRRAEMPLIKVNCAAIPANLIESEFFGHEKGAFTGATAKRDGRFALADGGTIFLDEIGELPLDLQSKLLRVLQEGEFEPIGSSHTRKVDVRVIVATNRDLRAESMEGRFREDLYYRISVFPIHVPALRSRGNDVALLASEFVRRIARRDGRKAPPISETDSQRLCAYSWPGNVRELVNVVERALITGDEKRLNLNRALPTDKSSGPPVAPSEVSESKATDRILTTTEMVQFEAANIQRALAVTGGKVSGDDGAAALLEMKPSTLSSRIKALGIQ